MLKTCKQMSRTNWGLIATVGAVAAGAYLLFRKGGIVSNLKGTSDGLNAAAGGVGSAIQGTGELIQETGGAVQDITQSTSKFVDNTGKLISESIGGDSKSSWWNAAISPIPNLINTLSNKNAKDTVTTKTVRPLSELMNYKTVVGTTELNQDFSNLPADAFVNVTKDTVLKKRQEPQTVKTTLDGRQTITPRAGGGYTVTGAKNLVVNKKSTNKKPSVYNKTSKITYR